MKIKECKYVIETMNFLKLKEETPIVLLNLSSGKIIMVLAK
jgi:hypothetical protein